MLGWMDIILRLGGATLIGCAIGLNRELHHKATGMRTLGLVALGSALAVLGVAPGRIRRRMSAGSSKASSQVSASWALA